MEYEKEKWCSEVQTESLETEKHRDRQEKRKMTFMKTRGETGTNTVEMYKNRNMEETFWTNGKLLTKNEVKENN